MYCTSKAITKEAIETSSNYFLGLKFGTFDYQKLYNFTNKIGKNYTDPRQPPETLAIDDKRFSFEKIMFGDYDKATYSTTIMRNKYNKQRTVFTILSSEMLSNNKPPGIRVPIGTMSITTGQLNKYNTSAISVNRPKPKNDTTPSDYSNASSKPDNMYIVFITKNGNLSIFGKYFTTVAYTKPSTPTNTSMYNKITGPIPIKLACRYYIDIDNSHKIVEEVVDPLFNYDYKDFKYKPLPGINNGNPVYESFDIKPSEYWKNFGLSADDLSKWERGSPENFKRLPNATKLINVSDFDTNNNKTDPLNSDPSNSDPSNSNPSTPIVLNLVEDAKYA
jgi:hypothetical protein